MGAWFSNAQNSFILCKETEDLVQSSETLKTGFVSRGYKEEYINTIDNYRRNELLTHTKVKERN